MIEPKHASDLEVVFGGHKLSDYLPAEEDIPQEFWDSSNPWNNMISKNFCGVETNEILKFKNGLNPENCVRHIRCILASFQPKHEHKIAGVAYLSFLWMDLVEEG